MKPYLLSSVRNHSISYLLLVSSLHIVSNYLIASEGLHNWSIGSDRADQRKSSIFYLYRILYAQGSAGILKTTT